MSSRVRVWLTRCEWLNKVTAFTPIAETEQIAPRPGPIELDQGKAHGPETYRPAAMIMSVRSRGPTRSSPVFPIDLP